MIDWREGTETQGIGGSFYWDVRDGLVRVIVTVDGSSAIVRLDREQARNMMCGLAHVLGEMEAK